MKKTGAATWSTAERRRACSSGDPTQLRAAYTLPAGGSGRPVAIVDAYGYPNLQRDLAAYRSFYGMPACTTGNGCLRILNQTGGTTFNVRAMFRTGASNALALPLAAEWTASKLCLPPNQSNVAATLAFEIMSGGACNVVLSPQPIFDVDDVTVTTDAECPAN